MMLLPEKPLVNDIVCQEKKLVLGAQQLVHSGGGREWDREQTRKEKGFICG